MSWTQPARSSSSRSSRRPAAPIEWDRPTTERAVRAGLEQAIDDAKQRDSIGGVTAFVLRQIAARAPIGWLISGAETVAGFAQDVSGQSLEEAIREKLQDAIDSAEESGKIGRIEALALRKAVELAPIDWLLQQAEKLAG